MANQTIPQRFGRNQAPKICLVNGCTNKHKAAGCCNRHYSQLRNHGKVLKRTAYDPNEFIVNGDECRIKLYNKQNKEIAETIIDTKNLSRVIGLKWSINGKGYVRNETKGLGLGNYLMGSIPNGYQVDHKDRDPLNNRESNLRLAIPSENSANMTFNTNTSGFKGVSWRKNRRRWISRINYQNKSIYLGYFMSKKDAAKAYDKAAIRFFGDFAVLNFKQEDKK